VTLFTSAAVLITSLAAPGTELILAIGGPEIRIVPLLQEADQPSNPPF
jgi:hypothetical protein